MNLHIKFGRALLACFIVVAPGILGALSSTAQAANAMVMVTPATRMHKNDQVVGSLALSQTIHVMVSLKLRNEAQLKAFLANPHHKILSPAQFKQAYSPTAAQAAAVVKFLRQAGFSHITVAPNRQLVSADAPASAVQTAFHTQLVSVYTHDGRNAYANSTPAEIPVSLQSIVHAVMGLQTVHVMHSFARPLLKKNGVPTNGLNTFATPAGGYNPLQFPAIYGASVAPVASGVTVAIIAEGDMTNVLVDLSTFTSNNSLPSVTTQVINTGGTSTDTSGDAEWDLDSQDIVGMAGGQVGKLIFYAAPSLSISDLSAAFNKAVTDDSAKIINVSLGLCETNWSSADITANDAIFAQADAQGQTFAVASGDAGADECSDGSTTPSYPASSPYVVAVGGTTLSTTGSTPAWSGESVWNSSGGASGGSPSTVESIPSWQVGIGQNGSSSYRGVPDIAYDADPNTGASVIVDTVPGQYGGTSLAAPLFAGAWARVIQAKGTSVGFAAPFLYQLASNSAATTFHDVTSGNNISTGDTFGETAASGWDYCTGWGSMLIDQGLGPTATDGTLSAIENTQATGTLTANDWDGDTLTFSIVSQPTNGSVSITNSATGAFTYTPNVNYYGSDTFTFEATDSGGMISNIGTETINVDSPPVATAGSVVTIVNRSVSGTLSGSDPDGDTALTYSVATQPANGTVSITNTATGAFTYTPATNYAGGDSFTFTVTDSAGLSATATESITFTSNNPPTASAGSVTTSENNSVSGILGGSDSDGDTLNFAVTTTPGHGGVSITNAATGAFTYTPTSGYAGSDSFTFTVTDSVGLTSTATESITVTINNPPVATAGSVTTTENNSVTGILSASDSDGDTLSFAVTNYTHHGTVSITNTSTGAFTYTPTSGYSGGDSFTFTVTDSAGLSSTAMESVTTQFSSGGVSSTSGGSGGSSSGGGGGGATGPLSLLGLILLPCWCRRRTRRA